MSKICSPHVYPSKRNSQKAYRHAAIFFTSYHLVLKKLRFSSVRRLYNIIICVIVCAAAVAGCCVCLYIKIQVCVHTYLYLFVRAAAAAAKQESSIGPRLVLIRLGVYSLARLLGIGSVRSAKKLLRRERRVTHTQMKRPEMISAAVDALFSCLQFRGCCESFFSI
jgi:hypothetical protein